MNLDFFAFRIANSNNDKLFIFLKFLFLRALEFFLAGMNPIILIFFYSFLKLIC